MDPKQIVAQGYDHIAEYHRQWASRTRTEERQRYTTFVLEPLCKEAIGYAGHILTCDTEFVHKLLGNLWKENRAESAAFSLHRG